MLQLRLNLKTSYLNNLDNSHIQWTFINKNKGKIELLLPTFYETFRLIRL